EQGKFFSYIDLATNKLYVYDLSTSLGPLGVNVDPHAIAVDRRGVVWMSDQIDQAVVEFDTRGGGSLDSPSGTLIVHKLPDDLRGRNTQMRIAPPEDLAGVHGIDVILDDKTGQATVYLTE